MSVGDHKSIQNLIYIPDKFNTADMEYYCTYDFLPLSSVTKSSRVGMSKGTSFYQPHQQFARQKIFAKSSRVTGVYLAGDGELNDVRVIMDEIWEAPKIATKSDNKYRGTLYWQKDQLKTVGLRYDSKSNEIKTFRVTAKDKSWAEVRLDGKAKSATNNISIPSGKSVVGLYGTLYDGDVTSLGLYYAKV